MFGDDENPFRMKKLNLIWRKAQNKMSERKLSDFRRLLEMQDRAEMKWKEVKANGGDETGEREAILRRKFAYILEEFGLEKHLDLVHDQGDEIKDNTAGTGAYGDARLNELWNSVLKQGLCSILQACCCVRKFESFFIQAVSVELPVNYKCTVLDYINFPTTPYFIMHAVKCLESKKQQRRSINPQVLYCWGHCFPLKETEVVRKFSHFCVRKGEDRYM